MLPNVPTPYSIEAEEALIGSIIVDPNPFDEIATWLKPEDFYILRHSYLWEAFIRMRGQDVPIDNVTTRVELQAMNRLTDVGGPAFITQLANGIAMYGHAEVYGRIVERAAIRRRIMRFSHELLGLAADTEQPIEYLMAEMERGLAQVTDVSLDNREESWRDIIHRAMDRMEYRLEHPEEIIGLPTGFTELDDIIGALQRTDFLLLAARPGMGKTSLLLSVALNILKRGGNVGIFSKEMNRDQLFDRFASMVSGINLLKLRLGRLTPEEYSVYIRACKEMSEFNLLIEDSTGMTPPYIKAKSFRWKRQHGLDLVMVDYLQILSSGGLYVNDRVQEVGYFAREMKQNARELDLPVLGAAQLNRGLESRPDKHPILSDLRESGELEQEADVVMFLYRDVVYNENTLSPALAEVDVAKQRNGPTGRADLHFEKTTTLFSNRRVENVDLRELGGYTHVREED